MTGQSLQEAEIGGLVYTLWFDMQQSIVSEAGSWAVPVSRRVLQQDLIHRIFPLCNKVLYQMLDHKTFLYKKKWKIRSERVLSRCLWLGAYSTCAPLSDVYSGQIFVRCYDLQGVFV